MFLKSIQSFSTSVHSWNLTCLQSRCCEMVWDLVSMIVVICGNIHIHSPDIQKNNFLSTSNKKEKKKMPKPNFRPQYEPLRSLPSLKESYVFLSGTVYGGGGVNPDNQCFCRDTKLISKDHPIGKCYPVAWCGDCDLNLSGQCSQSSQNLTIPGV